MASSPITLYPALSGLQLLTLADFLHVNLKTLRRWKSGEATPPHAVIIALRLKLDGDLSAVGGDEWRGFTFGRDGKLYPPFFRGCFTPAQICAMFFEMQELRHLRRENVKLNAELTRVKSSAWASDKLRAMMQPDHAPRNS